MPLALAACGWMSDDRGFIVNRSDDYLEAQAGPELVVPPDLSADAIQPLLVIPDLQERPHRARFPNEAPRPEAIYAREETQGVKIQKLGERRWLVIPQPPAVVWSKVRQFFADNGVPVSEAPDAGRIDTAWLQSVGAEPRDVVRLALREGKSDANLAAGRDRILVRVEQGVRERSSEIHIRYVNDSASNLDDAAWPEESTLVPVESELLNELGAYIAADVASEAVSLVARNLEAESKAVLDRNAAGTPVLRLQLDFDRAWAVLGTALSNAQVEVTDLDRTSGIYYVNVDEATLAQEEGPGFLGRLFGGGDEKRALQLLMTEGASGYQVSVQAPQGPVPAELAERLLALIREYAT